MDPITRIRVLKEIEKGGHNVIKGIKNSKNATPKACGGDEGCPGPGETPSLPVTFNNQAPVDWV